MAKSIMDLVAEAKATIPSISVKDAIGMLGRDDALIVDVRDPPELADTGKVQGALNVSRGMIEFRADDKSPYHNEAFSKDKTIILYCVSGGRSALAGKALRNLGFDDVRNLGGFKDWAEAGGPVEKA
jgi:rhodanese-related sulfurtransferase